MTGSASTSDRARRIAGWAVFLGGLVAALISLASAEASRRWLFDHWQNAAPRAVGGDKVAVVMIDSRSLDTIGPWPWPRYYIARLTEELVAQRPRVVGFDMIFAEPDPLNPVEFADLYHELDPAASAAVRRLPDMDEIFGEVVQSAPVLLPRLGVSAGGIPADELLVEPIIEGSPPAGVARYPQVLTSLPALDGVSAGHAVLNGAPDDDAIVRRVPLTVLAGDRPILGLAVELARIHAGAETLAWRGRSLDFAGRALPSDTEGRLAVRFGRFPQSAVYSADAVIAGQVPPDAFAGKAVLVGLGAEGTSDIVATPLETEQYGVLVQAQAVDAILSGGWLARPAWLAALEWLAGAALVALVVLAATARRRKPAMAAGAALAVALPIVSWLLFDRANLLFDPLRPLTIGLGAATALAATLFVLTRAERARLAAELTEQRVAAAAQEGELTAARRIQLGMVPGAARLSRIDPRVDIGAVLQPARSVGGDFYDVRSLGDNALLFVIGDVTGKGVPAALYMALSKALAKAVLTRGAARLGEAMAALNRDLMAEADEEMGVTLLAGVLDCATGAMMLVSAGHENPLVIREDGSVEVLALRGGPPLCVIDFDYRQEPAQLGPGETLVLITDGATEAADETGALLGLDGVIEALRGHREMSAEDRAAELARKVQAFGSDTEASDDLTILTLRRV